MASDALRAVLNAQPGSALHQEELPDFVSIRTDEIDAGDRLRPIDPVWAEALGQIMAREGQDTPIQVCRLPGRTRWTLVVGGHRHAGAISAGIEYLRAEIVSADREDRRLREVRENLWRSDLTPIDRAAFIAEAVAIHKRRAGIDPNVDGRVASIAARWQKAVKEEAVDTNVTMTVVYGFTDAVASELGLSASSVARDLMLYKRLAPSLVERLRATRHPILSNGTQLRTLAKLDDAAQAKVVSLLVDPGASGNHGQPKTVADAISHPLGPKPAKIAQDAESKRFNSILGTLKRMTAVERMALFQSPQFHDLIPSGARALLAPMRRDGANGIEGDDDGSGDETADASGREAGLGGVGGPVPDRARVSAVGGHIGRVEGEGASANDPTLAGRSRVPAPVVEELESPIPAVAIRASVKPDYLVCLDCGERVTMLKRHISTHHQLTRDGYIQRWKLPLDYPFVAPNYAEERRKLAAKIGLTSLNASAPREGDEA